MDARERTSIAEFFTSFDALDAPFDEHADPTHVSASAIVVGPRGVLLHRHKRLGVWLQPGGHVDAGETPWAAARREAAEETGLPIAAADPALIEPLIHVDVHAGPKRHRHLDLRYLVEADGQPAPPVSESQDVRWWSWREAIDLAEPGLEGVLRALQPGSPAIRQAAQADARGCANVYLRSRRFAIPEVVCIHPDREVRRWVADDVIGRVDCVVADVGGIVVGWLVLDRGWIEQCYVDPAWIGRGIGDRFVELAKHRHPDGLDLWTFAVNGPARRFYERHGFVEIDRTDGRGNEERAPDVRYHWPA